MATDLMEALSRVESVLDEHPELHDVFETWAMHCLDRWLATDVHNTLAVRDFRSELKRELARHRGDDLLTRARRAWLTYVIEAAEEDVPLRLAA